ncbi:MULTISPECIES: ApeA N-terminal domain 1-containing protein [Serratia]|nr:HEPN domain-containing protein [Serratia marcescens]EME1467649.1 hypothetical protein [Serratia marcescens]MBH1871373.1 hypothetical protein [Serratia marcescens]MBH2523167.1 hypothetical protein [Serratia marcescens]MBH2904705.1 hypothetical protein [Serratia marcescens]MBH2912839.1 hypothetical protein [Serratia marcescens]
MAGYLYDFTKEHSFHGEFWNNPNDNKGRFSAKIEYTPYNGLTLDYCISDSDSPTTCQRLYGVLNTGEPCTLIGPFDFLHSSIHFGKLRVLTGKHYFKAIIFNGMYTDNDSVEYCDLSLYGMQEFIHPQGFISQLKHSTTPILSTQGTGWKIDVINNATFSSVGDDVLNIINCQNEEALNKFTKDFLSTKKQYPEAFFSIRKNLKFYLRYTNTKDESIIKHIDDLWKMTGLFSILLDKPVIPDELNIKFKGQQIKNPCLLSNGIEQRTIDLALTNTTHHLLPLNWKQINMGEIISNWFNISDEYDSLSVTYQYETGYRTLHQAHADIILFATQLESINLTLSAKNSDKYIGPINKYASSSLKNNLESIFSKFNKKTIGENITIVRGELAHVGRPKKLMKVMTIDDYIKIGLYLKVTITSHLLSKLGLTKEQIERYQSKVAP